MTRSPRRIHRSLITAAVPLVAAALVLTGCGRGSGSAPAASTLQIDDKPATGTINIWADGADGADLPKLLAPFERDNPKVKVSITQIPEGDFSAKLTAAIASGTVPDLVYLYSQDQPTLLATNGFAPVPDGLVDPSSFFPAMQKAAEVDGVAYAVPWYTYANVFMYRKDLAEKAGASAPQNWDELVTFAKKLKADGVANPLGLSISYDGYSAQELTAYAKQNGGSLISSDLKKWTINDPKNIEALEFWGSLITDGYASADSPTFLDTVPFLSSGKIAGITNGPWLPGWLEDANGPTWNDSHLAVVEPPAGPDGSRAASIGGGSLAVLKDAKNPTAAWKLTRWMAQPDTQVAWYKIFKNLPAVEKGWDDESIAGNAMLKPVRDAIAHGVSIPTVPGWGQVGKIVGQQMERVARGTATAKQALDDAQQQAEAIGTGVK
ncbi:extracellular solute-binding protein [Leifsonia sp. NPDC102414]|uniref:extracellular solute-binding protein n=1 Tax=Leifsonia sp. NPDC102414 TaxID=3364124 RepID=UPI00380B5671